LIVALRGWVEVLAAVELDREVPFGTVEVQDVWAAGMLPSKLEADESFVAEVGP